MKVLVLGGTGFIGRDLQQVIGDWTYVGRREVGDLSSPFHNLISFINDNKITHVVNLASVVGGIKYNRDNGMAMFEKNLSIAKNVFEAVHRSSATHLICASSTCAWPDKNTMQKPSGIYDGPPFSGNAPYSLAKRNIHLLAEAYRKDLVVNIFAPCNVYGPGDDFYSDNAHFIPSVIRKINNSKGNLELWGTGEEVRQHIFVRDVSEKILDIVNLDESFEEPIVLAPPQYYSNKEVIEKIAFLLKSDINISYNGSQSGQKFKVVEGTTKFGGYKTLQKGLEETIENYKQCLKK